LEVVTSLELINPLGTVATVVIAQDWLKQRPQAVYPNVDIRTKRLQLVAATMESLEAEAHDHQTLARLLDADVPSWPPPLNDDASLKYLRDHLTARPDSVGWVAWYFIRAEPPAPRVVIGNGGFKGPPSNDGIVEIGYSLFPEFHHQGYATEAVTGLVQWAFANRAVRRVTAQTLPGHRASIAVLERAGFASMPQPIEPGLLGFAKDRPDGDLY
jgi:[ribosomal protein S5]-alanine N-acetyltransferase